MGDDLVVAAEDPRTPEAAALVAALDAENAGLYPPASQHRLSAEALARPGVIFVVARRQGQALACGAVVAQAGYGEIKRMYVAPARRGGGLAAAVLRRLEAGAMARGLPCLRLETGTAQPAALRFYRRAGFTPCGPFGAYAPDPLSVYMEKALPALAFRPVAAADADILLAMVEAFHGADGRVLDARSRAAVRALCAGESLARAWLVARSEETVGYLVLTRGWGIEYGGPDVFLDELYLQPAARGSGIGGAALAFAAETATAWGAAAMHLVVAPDNDGARRLYGRHAFADAGWRLMSLRL